jgi:DNA-directed RNA polymerase III subunit RPC4
VRSVKKDNEKHKGLKPIRLPRFAHKERAQILNTDSSTAEVKKEEDESDSDPTSVEAYTGSVPPAGEDSVQIKEEPTSPSSPRLRRKTQPHSSAPTTIDLDSPPTSPTVSRVKPPTSPVLTKKPAKKQPPVFSCEEDKEEYARHLEDVAILARELGGLQSKDKDADGKGKGPAVDSSGDVAMSDGQDGPGDARAGRLYLFQFPPVLPKLYNPLTTEKPLPEGLVPVKQESDKKGPASPVLSKVKPKPGDSSNDQAAIKPEPEEEILTTTATDDPNARIPRDRVVAEPGYVGKLIVRESGKVELNWGGASLVVGRGVDASFLTMGVILDRNEKSAANAGSGLGGSGADLEGKAMGMGQIMGKFVVKPDWEKMFGNED